MYSSSVYLHDILFVWGLPYILYFSPVPAFMLAFGNILAVQDCICYINKQSKIIDPRKSSELKGDPLIGLFHFK